MNKAKARLIFEALKKANPHPTTELRFHSPFELLVAVMLSAQATDKSVNKATETLFSVANTPEAMLALGEEKLKQYIKTIGLFNTKAKHLIQTCSILVNEYQGKIPKERKALETLPGIGRKTANVILNTAFGLATIAVDTHIFRVANRTGLAKGTTPLAVEKGLEAIIDKKYLKDAHHWLVLHGRYICIARKPLCKLCVIEKWCEYDKKCL